MILPAKPWVASDDAYRPASQVLRPVQVPARARVSLGVFGVVARAGVERKQPLVVMGRLGPQRLMEQVSKPLYRFVIEQVSTPLREQGLLHARHDTAETGEIQVRFLRLVVALALAFTPVFGQGAPIGSCATAITRVGLIQGGQSFRCS